ncbi:hypothetical protein [Natrinema soli]|uniref:Uncharacterized protein n=1 Tax=Natrinema soli TaxID=1930624 RepID=A0ABD5SNK8_9EURY|nr:hypothetical protein [Natrinema soli]
MVEMHTPEITARDRERLAAEFDVNGADVDSVDELRTVVDAETVSEFASIRETIRNELTGQLDVGLVESTLADLEAILQGSESVREAGVPARHGDGDAGIDELYRELIAPIWDVYEHLVAAGFFESLEETLPAFTPEHIEHTASGMVSADELLAGLTDCGFDDHERTALLLDVINNNTRLSHWVPTQEIPDGVEFNVEYVPPLYHRAIGGGLLWIKALDRHLVQKEILLTEEILDDAHWRSKAILGGISTFLRGVRAVAADDQSLTDEQVVAALSAGTAITIVNQEELMQEAFWIHEEKRAPSPAR